jgi:hypothetical protein
MPTKISKTPAIYTFGVGCFHFQKLSDLGKTSQKDTYLQELIEFLKQDNLITEVSVEDFDENEYIGDFFAGNYSDSMSILDTTYLYPNFDNGKVNFKITIPKRLQHEYLGEFREALVSENFDVNIVFTADFPIAFVVPEKPEVNPSSAVVMLWRHMKKNLKDKNSIRFHMLGPSPFHADFIVTPSINEKMEILYIPQYGYDRIEIHIPEIAPQSSIREAVEYRLKDEISLFYRIIYESNSIGRDFSVLANTIEKQIGLDREKTFFHRLFGKRFDIYSALIDLEKIETEIQSLDRRYRTEKGWARRKFGEIILEDKLKEEIDEIKETQTTPYKNILLTMKDRYAINTTSISTIISGILGVLVGYFLTSLGDIMSLLK